MDFNVAGTVNGVTALHMDIKIQGITKEIMQVALAQAKEARMHILGKMQEALGQAKTEVSDFAPRLYTMKINPEKIRDVIGKDGLEKVFDVLRAPFTEEPTNWSRRYKANLEKLASGDVIKVSEVVRDLWRRDQDRGLSAGEKRMLAKARQILISEIALALKADEDKASSVLDEVLAS